MVSGQDILILSTQDWDALPTRKHHWARAFARQGNRVLFVEQQMHLAGWLYEALRGRQVVRAVRWLRGPRPVEPNVWVFTLPVVLPFFQMSAVINRLNNSALTPVLRRALRGLQFRRPILWAYTPHSADFVGRLGERLTVYECVDEFSAAKGLVRSAAIAALERRLLERADQVIVTAPALLEAKRRYARRIALVPNGADVDRFRAAAEGEAAFPPDLARLPRPIIGFTGWVQYWVDFDLIAHAARAHPDWTFAIIGPVEPLARVDKVRGLNNVHFLGRKPYADIPRYVAGFDVCVNPFVLDGLAEAVSPIKLYEYLASGRPIVSVDMPAAREFDALIWVAKDAGEFLSGLGSALREGQSRAARRQAAAQGYSWAARFRAVEQILESALDGSPA